MKCLLIIPDLEDDDDFRDKPPLGVGYVSEYLIANEISHEVIDMRFHTYSYLDKKIKKQSPKLIGISMVSFHYNLVYRLINKIKLDYPFIKIVVGGPHASLVGEEMLQESEVDHVVIGGGGKAIIDVLNGEKKQVIDCSRAESMDNIFPTYRKFELNRYISRDIGIVTSVGCPYLCVFCILNKDKIYFKSIDNIFKEFNYWYKSGYRSFNILDDNFTLNRKRAIEICNVLKRFKGIKIKLDNGIRADKTDRDLLTTMKYVGFYHLHFGIETGNNEMLKRIKKGETMEQIHTAIQTSCNLGFKVSLTFIIDLPYHKEKDIRDCFALAQTYPIHNANFYNLVPFPSTKVYDYLKRNKLLLKDYNDYLNTLSNTKWTPIFIMPHITEERLCKLMGEAKKISKRIFKKYLIKNHGYLKANAYLLYQHIKRN